MSHPATFRFGNRAEPLKTEPENANFRDKCSDICYRWFFVVFFEVLVLFFIPVSWVECLGHSGHWRRLVSLLKVMTAHGVSADCKSYLAISDALVKSGQAWAPIEMFFVDPGVILNSRQISIHCCVAQDGFQLSLVNGNRWILFTTSCTRFGSCRRCWLPQVLVAAMSWRSGKDVSIVYGLWLPNSRLYMHVHDCTCMFLLIAFLSDASRTGRWKGGWSV